MDTYEESVVLGYNSYNAVQEEDGTVSVGKQHNGIIVSQWEFDSISDYKRFVKMLLRFDEAVSGSQVNTLQTEVCKGRTVTKSIAWWATRDNYIHYDQLQCIHGKSLVDTCIDCKAENAT